MIFICLQAITMGYCYLFLHFFKVWTSHTISSKSVYVKLCSSALLCPLFCDLPQPFIFPWASQVCVAILRVLYYFPRINVPSCLYPTVIYYNIYSLTMIVSLATLHLKNGKVCLGSQFQRVSVHYYGKGKADLHGSWLR